MALYFIFFTLIFFFITYKIYQKFTSNYPPGPRPWPIIGNIYQIKPIKFRCFAEWSQVYGPIISVWLGSTLNVVVNNSELAKEVLKENDLQLADRYRDKPYIKDGKDLIWADYGPHYVKVRKVSTLELLSAKKLEALRPIREDEVAYMVQSTFKHCTKQDKEGKNMQVRNYLGDVSFNNISRLVLGKRLMNEDGVANVQGLEIKDILKGVKVGALASLAEHIPWLRWMFRLQEELFLKHKERKYRLIRTIMEEYVEAGKTSGGTKHHFLDGLLSAKETYDLSDDIVIGLLWDMIIAGTDTTTISVEWAVAELIKNPRVQKKAQEELDNVIGNTRVMTESDFSNLPYLQCVVKESLRLHPPTPLMLPHRANANVKVGGYNVPNGSTVIVNVWAIARDPEVWENPLEFRPERFMENDVDMKGHDFRLLPFGAGRRICPGVQLGISLVTLMLGQLLHHFWWAPPDGVKPEEIDMAETPGLVTYMRTPLQVVPTPRLPEHLYKRVSIDA